MQSKWYDLKPAALALRRNGKSLSFIEANLGIPRSTLSGWCKGIRLTDAQQFALRSNSKEALKNSRLKAAVRHRNDKRRRQKDAEMNALKTIQSLTLTPSLAKLALAMLYWGEGKKSQATALGSTDPEMLLFFLHALETGFGLSRHDLSYELHLRKDQNGNKAIDYWSKTLKAPTLNFKRLYFDKRTISKTRPAYNGVCHIYCPNVAIQRELVYLYKLFSKGIQNLGD